MLSGNVDARVDGWVLERADWPCRGWRCLAKRVLDGTVAALLLLLVLPLALIVAALIALQSPGPILFAHPRIGRDGRAFRCLKFRTMCADAAERLPALLAADPAIAREWARHRKLTIDPRVTRLGAVLRATSLDELPQLLNVLRGDMSLVGPRPVTEEELLRYGRCTRAYLGMRPGITGLWQVSGRSDVCFAERVRLDDWYARRWSFWLDLRLIGRTPRAVWRGCGAR